MKKDTSKPFKTKKKKKSAFGLLDIHRFCDCIGEYTPLHQQRNHLHDQIQRNTPRFSGGKSREASQDCQSKYGKIPTTQKCEQLHQ